MKLSKIASIASVVALTIALAGGSLAAVADDPTPEPTSITATAPAALPASYQAVVDKYKTQATELSTAVSALKAETTSFSAANTAFKKAMKEWQDVQKANVAAKKAIGKLFKADLAAAKKAYTSAQGSATTAETKTAAKTARDSAVATATAARKAALAQIKAVPKQPIKPNKSDFKVSKYKATAKPTSAPGTDSTGKPEKTAKPEKTKKP
jgi:hypothetical protein